MRCPFCRADDDRVVDSRSSADGQTVRRRRHCNACGRRFTTYERVEETAIRVVKRDGSREPFERSKLVRSLLRATEKRPVSTESIEALAERIDRSIHDTHQREVTSWEIAERAMEGLKDLDPIAYVRYASAYRDFKALGELVDELKPLLGPEGAAP